MVCAGCQLALFMLPCKNGVLGNQSKYYTLSTVNAVKITCLVSFIGTSKTVVANLLP